MTTANEMIQTLRDRVKNEAMGQVLDQAFLLDVVDGTQRVINAALHSVVSTTTLTTTPYQQIYDITQLITDKVYVLGVQYGNKYLSFAKDWRELAQTRADWFRVIGSEPKTVATIGRDILIVHPGLEDSVSLTVVYVVSTSLIDDPSATLQMPDETLPTVADLGEALVLLRERRFSAVQESVKRLARDLGRSVNVEK